MALPATQATFNIDDFLHWEHRQAEKHEFWKGEIFAMTGARRVHVLVALNVASALKKHLRGGPCQTFISDMQLAVRQADAVFYPDILVSCHPDDLRAERVLEHPRVIVEILSDSTAAFDRGEKFAAYRQIPELQEYALIDPRHQRIEIFRRTDSGDWLLVTRDAEQGLMLKSLDFLATPEEVFESLPAPETFKHPVPERMP